MTAITLKRVDPQRNMSRFYKLDVQPTLLGGWSLIRGWPASVVRAPCASKRAPRAALLIWH
ncbi:hypothetical protein ABIE89_000846 [Bradyrhizobium niftali]|uniref:WGR domain-containing protein n=1 Tax=Bradyrhizobium niftali TaxID=2560055 RepID=UPI003836B32A